MKDWFVYALLGLAALGLAIGVLSDFDGSLRDFDKTDTAPVTYLFVQEAASGAIALNEDGTYTLTLADVSPKTLVFADRPVRGAFHMETSGLVAAFDRLFGDDPPNAALSYTSASGELHAAVFEVFSPIYSEAGAAVTYQAIAIPADGGGVAASEHAFTFGEASLFIDESDCGCIAPQDCPPPPLPRAPGCP